MMGHGFGPASASGDWSWAAWLAIVLVLAGLLFLVGWIAERRASDDPHADWDDLDLDPIGVLRMRYAYGEIDLAEFTAAKQTLESADQA